MAGMLVLYIQDLELAAEYSTAILDLYIYFR